MAIRKVEGDSENGSGGGGGGGTLHVPPAGLPSRDPTQSYWLRDPSPALLGHRGTPDLPETADVVVVGSGITGAFAARFLMEGLQREGQGQGQGQDQGVGVGGGGEGGTTGKRVVMLEAREACSGATGRVSRLSFSVAVIAVVIVFCVLKKGVRWKG